MALEDEGARLERAAHAERWRLAPQIDCGRDCDIVIISGRMNACRRWCRGDGRSVGHGTRGPGYLGKRREQQAGRVHQGTAASSHLGKTILSKWEKTEIIAMRVSVADKVLLRGSPRRVVGGSDIIWTHGCDHVIGYRQIRSRSARTRAWRVKCRQGSGACCCMDRLSDGAGQVGARRTLADEI